jgi:hypothetical protein
MNNDNIQIKKLSILNAKDLQLLPLRFYIEKIYNSIVNEALKGKLNINIIFKKDNLNKIRSIINELIILFPDVKFIKIGKNKDEDIIYIVDWSKNNYDDYDEYYNYDNHNLYENIFI